MLEVPQILRGKQAKEFIEFLYWHIEILVRVEWKIKLVTAIKFFKDLWIIILFYNQPFQPEMIEKYFLGWVYNGKNHYFTNGKDKIHYQKHRGFNYKGMQVKTLSQFITFTHSIKKEWRQI